MTLKEQALSLYKRVFTEDSDAFAKAFNDKYFEKFCKYVQQDGKIVSMLYLLDCSIKYGDKTYPAKYLYAAATEPQYRKQGIMGELIRTAITETNKAGKALITKPANADLFDYYGKFGFETCSFSSAELDFNIDKKSQVSKNMYIYFRERLLEDTPHIALADMVFALDGYELYGNEQFCAAIDAQDRRVKEYICKDVDALTGDIPFAMWVINYNTKPCEKVYFGIAMD